MAKVELMDTFGDDLMVVNAARISYDRQSDTLTDKDSRLIVHLARSGHNSPFYHPQAQFRITIPFYMARQLRRSHVGLKASPLYWADEPGIVEMDDFADDNDVSRNEVSRRYTSSDPMVELPKEWREAGKSGNPQVSGLPVARQRDARYIAEMAVAQMMSSYRELITMGVAPEQARVVLPVCTLTTWLWTGSLFAYAKLCRERLAPDAQPETRSVAEMIADEMARAFPVSWAVLMEVSDA